MSIEIKVDQIKIVDIETIKENPDNMNMHSFEQIAELEKLIEYHGFRVPLIIDKKTDLLIAGHGRLEAAKNLGMAKLPVTFQDFSGHKAEDFTFMVSDNEVARWAKLNKDALMVKIEELEVDVNYLGVKDDLNIQKIDTDYGDKNSEIDTDNFGNDLEHTCPRCGFEFNS